jgi:hypothetical protein
MDLSNYVDGSTTAALQRLLPGVVLEPVLTPLRWRSGLTVVPHESGFSVQINIPAAPGADYSFWLLFQPERQIGAALIGADPARPYFWYMPFEDAAYNNSVEKLDGAFFETLELLISHETRIVQKRGLFFDSFRCEYKCSSGWQRVNGMAGLRMGGFKASRIAGRKRTYRSPALAPADRLG